MTAAAQAVEGPPKGTLETLKQTFAAFNDDKVLRLAAAISYYAIFSIAPLFIIVIAVVGGILGASGQHGHSLAERKIVEFIAQSAGTGTADTVRALIDSTFAQKRQGLVAQVVGWAVFALGASGLFAALQDALNTVWHVEYTKGGWQRLVIDRVISFAMVIVVGFLLLTTLAATSVLTIVADDFAYLLPKFANAFIVAALERVVSVSLATIVFALVFKILPDVRIRWRDVWVGAIATAVLFVVGETGIAFYLAHGNVGSAYGAAGSILIALLWIYYSTIILLLGAEFTKVRASSAKTVVLSAIRHMSDAPAGVDPRYVGRTST